MEIKNGIKIIVLLGTMAKFSIAFADGFGDFLGDTKNTIEVSKLRKACDKKGDLEACYSAGKMLSENKNSEAARKLGLDYLKKGCEGGNFSSCKELAQKNDLKAILRAGEIAPDDKTKSEFLTKACTGGELKGCELLCINKLWDDKVDGCIELGQAAYRKSSAVTEEVKNWFRKSCDNGNPRGCGILGYNEKDPTESIRLQNIACTSGKYYKACYNLGFRYRTEGNLDQAEHYYELACIHVIDDSCEVLKEIRKEIVENKEKKFTAELAPILSKLKTDCDNGNSEACVQHAQKMRGNNNEKFPWYKRACDGGNLIGCTWAGLISMQANNLADAKKYLLKACDGNYPEGCSNLGNLELKKGNKAEAVRLYIKACNGGSTFGCQNLAQIQIDYGNLDEARKYLNQACDAGSNAACNKLADLAKAYP